MSEFTREKYLAHQLSRLAYRDGITQAITAPTGKGFMRGLLTAFDIGARHSLEDGAIIQEVTALQVAISLDISVSVSTQIAALRSKLLRSSDEKHWEMIRKVRRIHLESFYTNRDS